MMNKSKPTKKQEYTTHSEEETFLLAKTLSQGFKGNEVVLLEGELGTGKTVFAKGLAAGLGLKDVHQVCSPSYTLINIYQTKYLFYHVDLYRLGSESEVDELGWEDFLGQGVIVVEWADKLDFSLDAIRIKIEDVGDLKRKIQISANSPLLTVLFP